MTIGTRGWEVVEVAAAGTFGTVCVAMDRATGRLDAIKVLRAEHLARPRVLDRTRDEAEMLQRIDHPGIVRVHGLVEIEGRPVLAMEWTRGLSVEQVLNSVGPLPVGVALRIGRQVSDALRAAWEDVPAGADAPLHLIHRDVKPSNILVSIDGDVRLVDFGIAHADLDGKRSSTLSVVLGARGYLAPERLDGHDDAPSCDVYALGISVLEMVVGQHPQLSLHRAHHDEALERHLARILPGGLATAEVASLRQLLASLCHYEPQRRPTHAQAIASIDRWLGRNDLPFGLPTFARDVIRPRFAGRRRVSLVDHPEYADLAFLDRTRSTVQAAPDVDEALRALLARPDWEAACHQIEDLLLRNPHASAAPFLEVLPSERRNWFPWGGPDDAAIRKAVFALGQLQRFQAADVRRRVQALARHHHPDLARHARAFVEASPSEFP